MRNTGGRRADILTVLRRAEVPLSIAEIADQLGIHLNTVRFHLDALMENGRVERANTQHAKPGRPPQLFRAVRGMDPGGPRHYQLLAAALADGLARGPDPVTEAVAIGRSLGARLARPRRRAAQHEPMGQLLGLLDEFGFAPERPAQDMRIMLRNCPFFELSKEYPEVVCPLHLGLMQGAMREWDAPISVDTLTPFAEPDGCVTQLVSGRKDR